MKPIIMGKNCLKEVLKTKPKAIVKIYSIKKDDPILKEAFQKKIPTKIVSKQTLNQMVNSESHQGFAAMLSERTYHDPKTFLSRLQERALVMMSDGITDPQNFGAILRAGECFGVSGMIYSKNRNVDITPVVTKASVGASELVPLLRVSNLAETMKRFQDAGFTAIVADVDETSVPLQSFTFPDRSLLILGAEGRGVQPLLRRKADVLLHIPLSGQIDSLNVSQATAVMLSRYEMSQS